MKWKQQQLKVDCSLQREDQGDNQVYVSKEESWEEESKFLVDKETKLTKVTKD